MFYIQECRDIIPSLNTEILEKPWKSIKVTLFHGKCLTKICWKLPVLGNLFDSNI